MGTEKTGAAGDQHSHLCLLRAFRLSGCRLGQFQRSASNAVIVQSSFCHLLRRVEVTAIEHDWIVQKLLDSDKVQCSEFLPFGKDEQCIEAFYCGVSIRSILDTLAKNSSGPIHRRWIKSRDVTAFFQQRLNDVDRRRLTYIVSTALESQAQHREAFVFER